MKYFIMSDIHIDFFVKTQNKEYEKSVQYFEEFYNTHMQPAECLICAGDISNDYYNHVNFLKFIATKYNKVYVVFGNHDFGIHSTFGNGNPVKYSEQRLEQTKKEFENTNVFVLDGDIVDGVAGTMGMCDFGHTTTLDLGVQYKIREWQRHWYDSKVWHIKTPDWHNGYKIDPMKIYQHEYDKLKSLVSKQPKIIVTHFCPLELGINREYDNSPSTAYFYFTAKDLLESFDHETWWFCGHIHTKMTCDYTNSKGVIIHICALPHGYPDEFNYSNYGYKWLNSNDGHVEVISHEFVDSDLLYEF